MTTILSNLCAIGKLINGGGRGIRTPARYDPPVGFQDRSLQPNLGIPPYRQKLIYHIIFTMSTY